MLVGRAVNRFLQFGNRVFTHDSWHRVAYQPVLFTFLWGAAIRVAVSDQPGIPIDAVVSAGADEIWLTLSLVCPPLAFLSWFLILKSRLPRASLIGLWLRLAADMGQFVALLVFHIVSLFLAVQRNAEIQVYYRYLTGATLVFVFLLALRDIWSLLLTERLATRIREDLPE